MSIIKVSAFPALTAPADGDRIPIVDVSDTTSSPEGTTKSVTVGNLLALVPSGPAGDVVSFDPAARYVLRLEGGAHVDHGRFWPAGETYTGDLGAFLWDAWCVHLGGEYLISDGYGGAHALLWGFGGDGSSQTGNIRTTGLNVSFAGAYIPGPEEWVHIAVGWDGLDRLCVYVNGLLDGMVPFAGPRVAIGWGVGAGGHLYVGGSDHSNGYYLLAMLRGFERINPLTGAMARPFLPERFPSRITADSVPCAFYADYTSGVGGATIHDTSPGGYDTYDDGSPVFHHGRMLNNVQNGLGDAYSPVLPTGTMPVWVLAADCPLGRALGTSPAPVEIARAPSAPPSGSLVYDSFGRANQTLAFQVDPTLGSTEAGSLGPLVWQYGRLAGTATPVFGHFGILGGQAVCTSNGTVLAWVPIGTANMDLRAARSMATRHDGAVGIAFRVVDANNWWSVYFQPSQFITTFGASRATGHLMYTKVVAGAVTFMGQWDVTHDAWTHLKVTAVGNVLTFSIGTTSGYAQVGQVTDSTHATGQGAGITNLASAVNTTDSLIRWDDFAALPAS